MNPMPIIEEYSSSYYKFFLYFSTNFNIEKQTKMLLKINNIVILYLHQPKII